MCKFGTIVFSLLVLVTVIVFDSSCGVSTQRSAEARTKSGSISVTISPNAGTVQLGKSQQFTAIVQGAPNDLVRWTATNGSITTDGVFTANGSTDNASVTVTSVADSRKSATGYLSVNAPSAVLITVLPSTLTLQIGEPQQFIANVRNATNTAVTWSSSGTGTINSSGLYVASTSGTAVVMAMSVEDPTIFATAQVVVKSAPTRSFDGPAELPRISPPTLLANTPAPGIVTFVQAGGELQTAINAASCGDTIQLEAGATFTGDFLLPAKHCDDSHWIIIRTSASDGLLPGEGKRITPCYASVASLPGRPAFKCTSAQKLLATLMTTKSVGPITLAAGASHYRLGPGLEITRAPTTGLNYGLIEPTTREPADHIIVDRDWVHGTAQDETTRGLFLTGVTYASVVDSYFSDFHCIASIGECVDAQAIAGGTGPLAQGIWTIENNFLEGSAETILFGGVLANSATPTDITIRRNHLFKPLTWLPGQPGFIGGVNLDPTKCTKWKTPGQCPFVVKNLFELKNAQRVLFGSNILENVWPGFSQHGESILISGLNPPAIAGATVNSSISIMDVTIRYNRIAHTTRGMSVVNMAGQGNGTGAANLPVARISIHDNIFDDMNPAYLNGDTSIYSDFNMVQFSSCLACVPLQRVTFNHNTLLAQAPKMGFILGAAGMQQLGVTFTNNIVSMPPGLVITGGGATGCGFDGNTDLLRLNSCLVPNYVFLSNALIGATGTWPIGNPLLSDAEAIQFTKYNGGDGGDYHLLSTSPFKNAATDGKDLGASVDFVQSAIDGVQ